MKFEIYHSAETEPASQPWRWRLLARNNEILASGEAYTNKNDCLRAVELVRNSCAATVVVEGEAEEGRTIRDFRAGRRDDDIAACRA